MSYKWHEDQWRESLQQPLGEECLVDGERLSGNVAQAMARDVSTAGSPTTRLQFDPRAAETHCHRTARIHQERVQYLRLFTCPWSDPVAEPGISTRFGCAGCRFQAHCFTIFFVMSSPLRRCASYREFQCVRAAGSAA